MENQRKKRGELTSTQIVTLSILIVSFIVILFFLFILDLGSTSDQEICKNSVVLKGTPGGFAGELDCKTQYITIESENKEEVMKTIADEMASCWSQFGEGKINYGDQGLLETKVEYAVCSIIEFDETTTEKISEISYLDLYNFLITQNKTTSQTYSQYLYGVNSVHTVPINPNIVFDISEDQILTSQKYSIITGIDNNPSPVNDVILMVYLIPTSEIDSRLEENREFITKA